jgi:hypothetical protein
VAGTIGSTIDANGTYTAGENLTGSVAVDSVVVTDNANGTSATAVVQVSALPVGELSRIAPGTIFSSRWRQRLQVLFISSDEGKFSTASKLSFNPQGDMIPLLTIAAGRSMLALVSVKTGVQGRYDACDHCFERTDRDRCKQLPAVQAALMCLTRKEKRASGTLTTAGGENFE